MWSHVIDWWDIDPLPVPSTALWTAAYWRLLSVRTLAARSR